MSLYKQCVVVVYTLGLFVLQTVWADSVQEEIAAHFRAGVEASRSGRFDRAATEFQAALRLDPTLAEAHANLGLAYHSLGDYKAAIRELEYAIRAKPDIPGSHLFLGIDYMKVGRFTDASVHLQAALRAQPTNREALQALATCYVNQERYRDALEHFRILWSFEPDETERLYRRAQTYLDVAKQLAGRMSQRYQNTLWANRLAGERLICEIALPGKSLGFPESPIRLQCHITVRRVESVPNGFGLGCHIEDYAVKTVSL